MVLGHVVVTIAQPGRLADGECCNVPVLQDVVVGNYGVVIAERIAAAPDTAEVEDCSDDVAGAAGVAVGDTGVGKAELVVVAGVGMVELAVVADWDGTAPVGSETGLASAPGFGGKRGRVGPEGSATQQR